MDLRDIQNQYEDTMHSSLPQYRKDQELGNLMTQMEKNFDLSVLNGSNDKKVEAMYHKISRSRSI